MATAVYLAAAVVSLLVFGRLSDLMSTVFLLHYRSAAIPSLIAGRLTTTFSLVRIASATVPSSSSG